MPTSKQNARHPGELAHWHGKCIVIFALRFPTTCDSHQREALMARWAIVFFVVALIAAVFGYGGIAGEAAWIGQILLFVFLVLAVASMLLGRRTARI